MIASLSHVITAAAPGAVGSFNLLDLDVAQALAVAAERTWRPLVGYRRSESGTALNLLPEYP